MLEQMKKKEGVMKLSGHLHRTFKILREEKPDRSTWNDEDKALYELFDFRQERRHEFLKSRYLARTKSETNK
jgi:hypothetical protein